MAAIPPKAQNAAQWGLKGLWKARQSLILVPTSQVGEGIHHGLAEYQGKQKSNGESRLKPQRNLSLRRGNFSSSLS